MNSQIEPVTYHHVGWLVDPTGALQVSLPCGLYEKSSSSFSIDDTWDDLSSNPLVLPWKKTEYLS
jgi:hypothetical protein